VIRRPPRYASHNGAVFWFEQQPRLNEALVRLARDETGICTEYSRPLIAADGARTALSSSLFTTTYP
jgi:hypothetical protein